MKTLDFFQSARTFGYAGSFVQLFRQSLLITFTLSDVVPIDGGIGVFVDAGFGGHEGSGEAEMVFVRDGDDTLLVDYPGTNVAPSAAVGKRRDHIKMIVVVKKMKFFLARTTSEQKQVVGVCCYDVDLIVG